VTQFLNHLRYHHSDQRFVFDQQYRNLTIGVIHTVIPSLINA
jgi:hypothetical protein